MRKQDELTNPNSCMSRARDGEMTFVLLGRDITAPGTIRFWVRERVRRGKNKPNDPQILEALNCAEAMEIDRRKSVAPGPQEGRDFKFAVKLRNPDAIWDEKRGCIFDGTENLSGVHWWKSEAAAWEAAYTRSRAVPATEDTREKSE